MKKLILLTFAAILPAAAADMTGAWTFTGSVQGVPVNMKCDFKQDGAKATATCAVEGMGNAPTTAELAAGKATLKNQVPYQGTTYDLTWTGTLDAAGNSMSGEIQANQYTGTFSGTRSTPTETWSIKGDVVGNAIDVKCVLKRDADKLSGTCTYQGLGESPTTGTVAGDKVTLQNRVVRDQPYDLTYNGTLDASGTAMKGDIAVAGVTGQFTGKKE